MRESDQTEFSRLRQQACLTIEQAADLLEVSVRTAYRYAEGGRVPPLALRTLREHAARVAETVPAPDESPFRFVDLFAGIGGLRLGAEAIGGRCVFTSEWDPGARKTYALNFKGTHEIGGDIREYSADPDRVPEHDVLLAGFPCQAFSIAGVSKKNSLNRPHGFLCDTQGTLFFDAAQIIAGFAPGAIKGAVPEAPRCACAPAALVLDRATPILAEGQGFSRAEPS